MFDWIKKILKAPPLRRNLTPEESVEALADLGGADDIEEVWDALDTHAEVVADDVRALVDDDALDHEPMHAAVLWLAYREGNEDRRIDAGVAERVYDAEVWAFGYDANHVLTGGALGALDALETDRREEMALRLFKDLGAESTRRYWLLMKVRTPAFLEAVAESLEAYDPDQRGRIVGGFRQFESDDLDVLLEHADLGSPGADLWIEALGSTRDHDALPAIRDALGDERPRVREAAYRAIELIKAAS